MYEFGRYYYQPGDELIFKDAYDALTSSAQKKYAKSGEKSMASTTPTPEELLNWGDEIVSPVSNLQVPPSEAAEVQETIEGLIDRERQTYETNYGREPNPQELKQMKTKVMRDLGLLPPERRTNNPAIDIALGTAAGDDDEALSKEERKSFRQPRSLNEMMESIEQYEPEFHKDFPLYHKEIDSQGRERTVVNEANFLRWLRKRMRFFEGEEGPDTKVNYFSRLGVPFGTREIHITQMLSDEEKFFKDTDGAVHRDLADQIRRELFARMIIRDRDIDYRTGGNGMSDESGIDAVLRGIFRTNNMTRNTWSGKSMWHWLLEMPHEVKANKEPNEHGAMFYNRDKGQDTRMGRGIATGIAAYYHLADYTKLREMIGQDSAFFTRAGFEKVRDKLAGNESKTNPFGGGVDELAGKYISDQRLNDIFGPDGKVNEDAFIEFVNFFPDAAVDPRRLTMVRELIRESIGHKYKLFVKDEHGKYRGEPIVGPDGKPVKDEDGHTIPIKGANGKVIPILDTETINLAEEYAFLTTRWTGIATRNDLGGTAYDAQAKWLRTKNYREKVADASRGGIFGNIYNVGMFKTLGVNYLDSVFNQDQPPKLLREMIEDLARVPPADVDEEKDIFDAEDLRKLEEENTLARQILSELTFPDLTELNLYNNGIFRWVQEYKSIISGDEPHFDKIVKAARTGGYLYNPAELGSKIQEGYLKPLRYGYNNWPISYEKQVRDIVEYDEKIHAGLPKVKVNGKDHVFADMSIADSMFGNVLLDRDIFWLQLDKDGKRVTEDKNEGKVARTFDHMVDQYRIGDNKTKLFKQLALGRIAADIYSHIDFNSPYEKWDGATIDAVVHALAIIPGNVLTDENDLKNTVVSKYFFNDSDIKWLRSIARVSEPRRFTVDVGKDAIVGGARVTRSFFKALWKGLK